jgi:hypothetical protein
VASAATLYGWMVTEPGFEPLHTLFSAISAGLVTLLGWLVRKGDGRAEMAAQKSYDSDSASTTTFQEDVSPNILITGGTNTFTSGAQFPFGSESVLQVNVKVVLFAVQETAYFVNKSGRYADQINFRILNDSSTAIESLKLDFVFPKIENLFDVEQYNEFRKVINRTDFEVHESYKDYRLIYRNEEPLLPGDLLEPVRPCIIYSMDLPDKDRWLLAVQNSDSKIFWKLFLNVGTPVEGSQNVANLYVGDCHIVE